MTTIKVGGTTHFQTHRPKFSLEIGERQPDGMSLVTRGRRGPCTFNIKATVALDSSKSLMQGEMPAKAKHAKPMLFKMCQNVGPLFNLIF